VLDVVMPDARGHGGSSAPERGYRHDDMRDVWPRQERIKKPSGTRSATMPPMRWSVLMLLVLTSPAYADRAITVDVDAREAPRRLLRAHLVIPAQPGKLVLRYAKWIPGEHGPTGPIAGMSSIVLTAGGKPVTWTRDPVDLYALSLDVPKGASEVAADVEFVLPESGDFSAGASATENLDVLSWNYVTLYPDGTSADVLRVKPSLRLPAGWKIGTALPIGKTSGDRTDFDEVSLTTLVDSPVLSGSHLREIALGDKARIVIASDDEAALAVPDDIVAGYKRLVTEASALFGARHYKSYTFLLTLSDRVPSFGLEHHESSDDRAPERSFLNTGTKHRVGTLLAHEYVHSWNGKYRRPAGLLPGRFDATLDTELLWVYEGLTEYLGMVLAARAGLVTPEEMRSIFALDAGHLSGGGRSWRPLADTAVAAQQLYEGSGWAARSRSVDYYPEGALLWLEVDAIIRGKTHGAKSIDDFCKAFHGGKDGAVEVATYTLEDVTATLGKVAQFDWKGFFARRVYAVRAPAPVEGLEASGWRLAYGAAMPPWLEAQEHYRKTTNEVWTAGVVIDEHSSRIEDVAPGSPADKAGIAPNMKIIAVNTRAYTPERLRDAIAATKTKPGLELLVQHGDTFLTKKLDVRGGPRFPTLERVNGSEDLLTAIFAAKAKSQDPL
jgi:predicted metalloprotease with PDZ domain